MRKKILSENQILALPVVLFLLAMLGFPTALDIVYSFSNVSFETLRTPQFSGLKNYVNVLWDEDFWQATWFSIRFGLSTAVVETLLGLFLAIFLTPIIKKYSWTLAILMLPIIIAPAMMGLMYRLVLHEFVGPLPYYLYNWFNDSPAFLGTEWVFTTIFMIETLQWMPFTLLLFYMAYGAIPNDIKESAQIDGARTYDQFRYIELPLMMPTVFVALFIRFIDGFRVFDNIYVLVGSGPGGSTTSLPIYIYEAFFKSNEIGKALAASVIIFIVAFLLFSLGTNYKKIRGSR